MVLGAEYGTVVEESSVYSSPYEYVSSAESAVYEVACGHGNEAWMVYDCRYAAGGNGVLAGDLGGVASAVV